MRQILNLEAELVYPDYDNDYEHYISIMLNQQEIYRFKTDQVYSIEEHKISLAELIAFHVKGKLTP